MENILQGVLGQTGVQAAFAFSSEGVLLGCTGHPPFDGAIIEPAAQLVAESLDSVELLHPGWSSTQIEFRDGMLLVQRVGAETDSGEAILLGVVADPNLNRRFTTVAIRVVANKLKRFFESPPAGAPSAPATAGLTSDLGLSRLSAASPVDPIPSLPTRASAGRGMGERSGEVSIGGLSGGPATWSSGGSVQLEFAEPSTRSRVDQLTRELARYVGPIAKLFTREVVYEVTAGQVVEASHVTAIHEGLAHRIEKPEDRALFLDFVP